MESTQNNVGSDGALQKYINRKLDFRKLKQMTTAMDVKSTVAKQLNLLRSNGHICDIVVCQCGIYTVLGIVSVYRAKDKARTLYRDKLNPYNIETAVTI